MKRRKDGRFVKIKFIDGERVPFYSSAPTEKQAIKEIDNKMLAYAAEKHKKKHNFKCLTEKLLDFHGDTVGYKTNECYGVAAKHLSQFNSYDIEDITPMMVQKLLDNLAKKGYSFSSISKVKTVFGLIIDYAIIHENLQIVNFMRSVKIPRSAKKGKVKAPDDFVIETIVNNAATATFGMWALSLLCTGWRRGELNAFRIMDADFDKDIIKLSHSTEFINNRPHLKGTKSDEDVRETPILKIYKPYLIKMCENRPHEEFVFGGEEPLTETMIKKRWKKYTEEIGYTFTGHQLRHAYAKLLYKAGIDPKTMQRLLGHADFSTTMNIYTEFASEVTEKSVKKFNEYMTKTYSEQ